MKDQPWFCTPCGNKGTVAYPMHAGVWEVAVAVRRAHRELAPDCREDPRIVNLDYKRFVSASCKGEICGHCREPAEHKIEETIFHDDPLPHRHPLTAYVCHAEFVRLMGPAADGT